MRTMIESRALFSLRSAMRAARMSLVMTTSGASMVACGSTPKPVDPAAEQSATSATSANKKLDCAFVRSEKNCWRIFAANLGACLGGRVHPTGQLSADLTSCALEGEVMAKLGSPCDPDGECEETEVFMGHGEKKCMEFHSNISKPADEMGRGVGSIAVTSAEGTVKLEYDEKSKTLTCPDGTVYAGSGDWKKELADCADEAGYASIPTFSFTKTPTVMETKKKKKAGSGTVTFEMSSMDVLFECAKP